jgi:benzoyl-CoA reductase/2-hydroxyglutaryl-CoA dehydratase subunit BcrC/BadD/HgdB
MIRRMLEAFQRSEDTPLEFDERYNVGKRIEARKRHHHDRLHESWQDENRQVISQLKALLERPKAMQYYDDLFTTETRLRELEKAKKAGTRIIGTFCNMVPEELIYAAGAIPLRLCSGCSHALKCGEEAFPRDSCSLIKSSLGFAVAHAPFLSLCDAVVIPGTCDGKKKLGEVLNAYVKVWMIELPQDKERTNAKRFWLGEVRILKGRLERLTRRKIDRKSLLSTIGLLRKRYDVIRRLHEIRRSVPSKISGSDAFMVIQAAFFDDVTRWTAETVRLCAELEGGHGIKEDSVRLLVTGSPIIMPNFKIPIIIEGFDAVIAMDETCAGSEYMYDPVELDEGTMQDMMNAIAERYLMPSMCPCFVKSEDRIDKLLDFVEQYRIDGVIYHTQRLCLLFDIESMKVRDVMEHNAVPFLSINTDYSKEDLGQLRTRIEAFIEIIHSRR